MCLPSPVFSCGQLCVAFSRARSFRDVFVQVEQTCGQGGFGSSLCAEVLSIRRLWIEQVLRVGLFPVLGRVPAVDGVCALCWGAGVGWASVFKVARYSFVPFLSCAVFGTVPHSQWCTAGLFCLFLGFFEWVKGVCGRGLGLGVGL